MKHQATNSKQTLSEVKQLMKIDEFKRKTKAKQYPDGLGRILEFYAKSQTQYEPNFKPEKPWADTRAEKVLKTLGAKPFRVGINPHGYELDVRDVATGKEDRLWFYVGGEVYSTNSSRTLGYIAKGNTIEMWNDIGSEKTEAGFKVGTITLANGKATFKSSGKGKTSKESDKEKEPAEQRSKVLDVIQTALDWLGLIPGIGDILDAVNGALSFIRASLAETSELRNEFLFDGFLSLIAIIPIVGSAIKLSMKPVMKAGKWFINMLTAAKDANKALDWAGLVKRGAITPEQLADLGSGLQHVSGLIKSGTSKINDIPFVPADVEREIVKELNYMADWIAMNGKHIDEMTDMAKKNKLPFGGVPKTNKFVKAGEDTIVAAASRVGFIRKFGNALTLGIYPRLKKLPWFPDKKLKQVANAMETRFIRDFNDPTKLTALLKTSAKNSEMIKSMNSILKSRLKQLPRAEQKKIIDMLVQNKSIQRIKTGTQKMVDDAGNAIVNPKTGAPIVNPVYTYQIPDNISPDALNNMLTRLRSDKAGSGMYDAIQLSITKQAMETDSPLWNMYMTDRLNNIKAVLSSDMIDGGSSLLKQLQVDWAKNADIIWNELTDFREKMNWSDEEDVNGVLLPIITMGVKEWLPGKYDTVKTWRDNLNKVKDTPLGKTVEDIITDETEDAYNPSDLGKGGTGGSYK